MRGRDIRRYGFRFADLWLIVSHNGVKEAGIPRVDIDDYPAVKRHLDQYFDKLKKRTDKGDTPYNLRNCAYMDDFSKQKIVWGEISDVPKFAIDLEGRFVAEATTFLMVGEHLKYLLCFLNSELSEYFFAKYGTTTGMGTLRWKKYLVELLPVPCVDPQKEQQICEELDVLLNIEQDKQANQIEKINALIYDIFGFTNDEVRFIKQSIELGAH